MPSPETPRRRPWLTGSQTFIVVFAIAELIGLTLAVVSSLRSPQ